MSIRLPPTVAWALVVLGAGVFAQAPQEPPTVRVVRSERIRGGVERPTGAPASRELGPMPANAYEVKDGVYRSVLSRITLRVPRIADEKVVDVRESVAMLRPDGSPATTHVMFDPDGTRIGSDPVQAQSAVVVTRLRDDRPKDADAILAGLDGGEAQRARAAEQGITYSRTDSRLGPALQRVIRNRAHTSRFPYDIGLLNDRGTTTYGITAYVIVAGDSMVEFSQLIPCGSRSDADCRSAALVAHKAFVDGVTAFDMYPSQGGSTTAR